VEPSWYRYNNSHDNDVGDPDSLEETRERIGRLVCEEVARLGGAGRRVFLGGASQGCTVALDIYLREASTLRLGGFVGSIGFIPSDADGFSGATEALTKLLEDSSQASRPVWIQCATDDRSEVPWHRVVKPSFKRVEGGGLPFFLAREVAGRGHHIDDWEGHIVNDYFRKHLGDMYPNRYK